jgi:uncharacterized cupin superfamily protein
MAETRRHPNVINLSQVEPDTTEGGQRFACTMKSLGAATGATGVGCSWHEVPPGRTAWPRHYHCANEEAMFVLEGQGLLRIGDAEVQIGPGDYATFPVGPAHAHQVRNTGQGPLRYLGLSTMLMTEIVGYPDSKKLAASSVANLEAMIRGEYWAAMRVKEGAPLPYFEGEDLG